MYKKAVKTNTTHSNDIAIGGSITGFNRGIRYACNKTLRSRWERFQLFLGALSKYLLHYIDLTLEEQNFEATIIHIGVSDILDDSSSREMNLLLQNIKEKGSKYKTRAVKLNVFISSLRARLHETQNELKPV